MPPFRKPTLVTLRRHDLSQPWGFRLAGGIEHGQIIIVQKVIPESIAHKSGLQEGDQLVRIGNITLKGLTHEEVQEIILRCISTIDLFVIRSAETEEAHIISPDQQTLVDKQYSAYGTGAKSLTEQVLNRITDGSDAYYNTGNCIDYSNPSSPPLQQFYVKEREMYEYNEYHSSPPLTNRPQSPFQKPPPSTRPFSPVVSPTSISYHQPEEQQWLSSQDQTRDPRVFAASPRAQSPSASPLAAHPQNGQRDPRVFGVKPRTTSPSPGSPVVNGDRPTFGSRPTTATSPSMTPSPVSDSQRRDRPDMDPNVTSPPPIQDIRQLDQQNQKTSVSPQDKQFYAQSKRTESHGFRDHGFNRPESGRPVNDRRVFGSNSKPRLHKMGGSLDGVPHWKEPLPQLKTVRQEVNQLLPSQTKRHQTYIVQTPPTEKNARPPPTGTLRRRIRPVWPPPDANGRYIPRAGFSPGGRDSPSRRYDWPPSQSQSIDEDYDTHMARMRYSTPPPGALQHSWNPRSGSETPPGSRSYTPSRRVKNSAWPPPSNATPAGRSGYRPQQSLPGSRRSSQADDYYVYTVNTRVPQSYRPPPNTQYFEPTYHYDTD